MLIQTPIFLKRKLNATPQRIDASTVQQAQQVGLGFTSRPADQLARSSAWIAALNVLDELSRRRQPLEAREASWCEGKGTKELGLPNQNRERWKNQAQ